MAQATVTTVTELATDIDVVFTPVNKGGDWVKPIILDDGSTVYAVQINKTQEEKNNIKEILKEYVAKNIPLYTYIGKNDKTVILVNSSDKIKATRSSVTTDNLVATAVEMFGCSIEQARAMVASAKSKATKK